MEKKSVRLNIGGMTCVNCENTIERELGRTAGIEKVSASYNRGRAEVVYDSDILRLRDIKRVIQEMGYHASEEKVKAPVQFDLKKAGGVLVLLVALFIILNSLGILGIFNRFPQAEEGMGYGMLFIIGLLTSVHCVAMCGGINLSQCIGSGGESSSKKESLRPSLLYNVGRVISYTLIGGIVGALGSVFSLSPGVKGFIQIAAGVFMIIMGLNLLNIFPWLRKLNPRMPKVFAKKINEKKGSNNPFYVGLLNGLMPCGPLQAMQLFALSTGDPLKGAFSMLVFSLGTVPLMFGIGALSSILSKKFTGKAMTVGAVLVIVLGVSMFGNGLGLSGFVVSVGGNEGAVQADMENDIQIIRTDLSSRSYEPITVQAGIPVRWTIDAAQGSINGCNNRILVPEYGIEKQLEIGENVIEFTPDAAGTFGYSCWMGMIRSTITVLETGETPPVETEENTDPQSVDLADLEAVIQAAGYVIPTDEIAVGEVIDGIQRVSITMEEGQFSPAVVVVERNLETEWIIQTSTINEENSVLFFPLYNAQVQMEEGENGIVLYPTEDFAFSTGDSGFFGYVKVVADIENVDFEAIRAEVAAYETTVWNPAAEVYNSGMRCH